MPEQQSFLSLITGSFSRPAAENPTVAMVEAAYEHHHINASYLNCEVAPEALGDLRESEDEDELEDEDDWGRFFNRPRPRPLLSFLSGVAK